MHPAPVIVFTYKKLEPLKKTLTALRNNTLAPASELIIFSDGPKTESDRSQVEKVRSFIGNVDGFKKVSTHLSDTNKGLAKSIIEGVSEIVETHKSVIVLEDDLITSANFLSFMNQALNTYRNDQRVHSIAGYTMPIQFPTDYPYDNYFTQRASSWGWATWQDRWNTVDWSVSDYQEFIKDSAKKKRFNAMGSDMVSMLTKQMKGKISSWAIRWCYDEFKKGQYTVFPTVSKVQNIGFGQHATHTKGGHDRFSTSLDPSSKTLFNFDQKPALNDSIIRQFVKKYSLGARAYYKIRTLLGV